VLEKRGRPGIVMKFFRGVENGPRILIRFWWLIRIAMWIHCLDLGIFHRIQSLFKSHH